MFRKSKILSALLTGLGVALIVGGLIAPRFLNGDGRLPLGLEDLTWTVSDPSGSYEGQTQPVTRQLHMEIRDPSDADEASIRIGDSLRAGTQSADFDNLVSASVWTFPMGRESGVPTGPLELSTVMIVPSTQVELDGQWMKFPSDTEQKNYNIFDATLRDTSEARFVGEEEIDGRDVYRFEQEVAPTNLAQKYADMRNTKTQVDEEGNQQRSFLYYGATRELMVDKISGLVVGINEGVDTYYADGEGRRVEDYLSYSGEMPREQTEAMLSQLDSVFSERQSRALTTGLIALGVLLSVVGLVGAFRPASSARSRGGKHIRREESPAQGDDTAEFPAVPGANA